MGDAASTLSLILGVVIGGVILLWALRWRSGWHGPSKSGARLPKGSFGWPVIGETLEYARNPATYASSHVKRYGSIFKSSLFLQPVIVGTSPEFAKFLTSNKSTFISGWPASVSEIIGPKAFINKDGPAHMSVKKILQKTLLPESLQTKVDILETIVLENLASWAKKGSIIGADATPKISLDVGMYLLLGTRDMGSTPEGRSALENFTAMNKSFTSAPVNLPGTVYNKGLKATAALRKYFKGVVKERQLQNIHQADVVGVLSEAQVREEVKDLDDDTVADNLLLFYFGLYDTTKTTLLWILKFLVDNPDVFLRVRAEQQEIFQGRDLCSEEPRLTWEDTKKMVYAAKFFQEAQRTLSLSPFVIRKATHHAEFEGNLIPKDWRVMVMLNFIHSDPNFHHDPESFNPDRFDVPPKPFTYLPFSKGSHMCPGNEIAKLLSFIYIHHLTTTYTFESAGPDLGVEFKSLPIPIGGYPITISRRK